MTLNTEEKLNSRTKISQIGDKQNSEQWPDDEAVHAEDGKAPLGRQQDDSVGQFGVAPHQNRAQNIVRQLNRPDAKNNENRAMHPVVYNKKIRWRQGTRASQPQLQK